MRARQDHRSNNDTKTVRFRRGSNRPIATISLRLTFLPLIFKQRHHVSLKDGAFARSKDKAEVVSIRNAEAAVIGFQHRWNIRCKVIVDDLTEVVARRLL